MDPDGSSIILAAVENVAAGKESSGVLGYIILLVVLIMLNAFFAMSEMAIVSLNDNKVRRMAQEGNKKAAKLQLFIDNPTNFLSTIQIGVTLSGFLTSAVAAETFVDMIMNSFAQSIPIAHGTLRMIVLIILTFAISFFTLVFGELVPKRIAMQNYEKISFAIVGILTAFTKVLKPFAAVVSGLTNGVLRLFGIDPNQQPDEITEEEIRMMLDVGNESGHIHQSDKDMIYNIFEFDDRYVEDIMTHRTEVVAVEVGTSLDEILNIAVDTGYSRIPVYEGDLDDIVGVLYVKDLLSYAMDKHGQFDISNFLRTPLYTIETTTCKALLGQFQETKIQLAIVVDEYGGTAGLVSMEDLLESIVGNIQDEYDDEEEEILELSENLYLVEGLTPLEDVFRFFALGEPDDEDDFDTIGGFILSRLGQIPGEDEHPSVQVGQILFRIKEMDERRIAKLEAQRLPEEDPEVELIEQPDSNGKGNGNGK